MTRDRGEAKDTSAETSDLVGSADVSTCNFNLCSRSRFNLMLSFVSSLRRFKIGVLGASSVVRDAIVVVCRWGACGEVLLFLEKKDKKVQYVTHIRRNNTGISSRFLISLFNTQNLVP